MVRPRPQGRRVRADQGDPRPPADQQRAGDVLGDVERALLLQVLEGAPQAVLRDPAGDAAGQSDGSAGVGKMLAGIGENAGVVDIGQGYAVTFKIESHNHPSYVEPYQGAATGVGGIVRDILAMGARPVAVMDPLRFGPLGEPDTHRVLPGIVAGVGGYGNCLGLPNIGGEAVFDASYLGNPLVNALCVGVLRHEDLHLAKATGVGNQVVLYGARTGGDGIGGVSVLASETFAADGPAKRPSVQVGDPFMEKLLIECTLELFAAGVVTGIQDLGGAGLSCATSELASAGDGGMHVDLDRVPLRDSSLAPEEILMSESQERMMAVVEPEDVERLMAICAKWDVEAVVIGEVTDTGRLRIDWHGEQVVDVPPRSVAHDGPTYHRPVRAPRLAGRPPGRRRRDAASARRTATSCGRPCCRLVASREPLRQVVDHRPVRPLRPRRHRARPAQRQRDDPRRRGDRARGLRRDRLQRPVRQARPVRRRAAGARRGLPQRGDRRRLAARGLRLPELRLARGPGRDVAVRRGLPRAQGRLHRARHPGHRRQRVAVQPDGRDRDPADARGRRARGDGRRAASYSVSVRRRGRGRLPAWRDPGRAVGLGVGPRRARSPRWPPAGRRPPGRARARVAAARRRRPADLGSRPVRRRPGAGAGRGRAAQRRRRDHRSVGRLLRPAVLRVRGALPGHGPPRRHRRPRGDGRRPRRTHPAHRHHRRRHPHRRGRVLHPPRRAPPRLDKHSPGRVRDSPVHSGGQRALESTRTHRTTPAPSTMWLWTTWSSPAR